jgi:radical SAM/Cys-rich protein
LNPGFRYLARRSRELGKHVIDRCNLTILEEPGQEDLGEFLAGLRVEITASLPHFSAANTDRQRGKGVFEKSVSALRKLNALGYGTVLPLNLVYNPVGLFLSSSQRQLEREFKEKLLSDFGIVFHNLYCINNMPINRFLESLERRGKFQEYMDLLAGAYNPGTLEGLMCRHQISVGYEGSLYDCDFNQMLEIKAAPVGHIRDFTPESFLERSIQVHNHCYGCTAGAGSSCGGEVRSQEAHG